MRNFFAPPHPKTVPTALRNIDSDRHTKTERNTGTQTEPQRDRYRDRQIHLICVHAKIIFRD